MENSEQMDMVTLSPGHLVITEVREVKEAEDVEATEVAVVAAVVMVAVGVAGHTPNYNVWSQRNILAATGQSDNERQNNQVQNCETDRDTSANALTHANDRTDSIAGNRPIGDGW